MTNSLIVNRRNEVTFLVRLVYCSEWKLRLYQVLVIVSVSFHQVVELSVVIFGVSKTLAKTLYVEESHFSEEKQDAKRAVSNALQLDDMLWLKT